MTTPERQQLLIGARRCLCAAWIAIAGGCGGAPAVVDPPPPAVDAATAAEGSSVATPEAAPTVVALPARPAHELERTFAALAAIDDGRADAGPVRILHIGDSHAASDTLTGRLRSLFTGRFGGAGRGYLYPGLPWESYRQQHAEYDATGAWTATLGVRRQWDAPLALGGVRMDGEAGAAFERSVCDRCTVATEVDEASVSWLASPGAGRFRVDTDVATLEVDAHADVAGLRVTRLPSGGTLRVTVLAGVVSFFGSALDAGSAGVTYEVVGMNGGRADQWVAFDDALTRDELAWRRPTLVVVAFGTNEAWGSTYRDADDGDASRALARLDEYEQSYEQLVRRYVEGAGGADCLVLLPPDCHEPDSACVDIGGDCLRRAPESLARVAAAQREVAERLGCAIWDQQAAMGGDGGMDRWQRHDPALGGRDGVHLTSAGYVVMAEQLFADLRTSYEAWRAGAPTPLQTTPVAAVAADE